MLTDSYYHYFYSPAPVWTLLAVLMLNFKTQSIPFKKKTLVIKKKQQKGLLPFHDKTHKNKHLFIHPTTIYWAPTTCRYHTRCWETYASEPSAFNSCSWIIFCCPICWFLASQVMPCDASALARGGRLACPDHHWNPPKSLASHVSAQQEGWQCPRSPQPWRKFYSLQIATDVQDPKHCHPFPGWNPAHT